MCVIYMYVYLYMYMKNILMFTHKADMMILLPLETSLELRFYLIWNTKPDNTYFIPN